MSKYASNTRVPVDRSRHEIETILERYGADSFAYATRRGHAMIEFDAHHRRIRFVMELPDPADHEFTRTPTGKTRADTAAREADGWVIPSSAVTVAGSRFKPGPHQYVVLPPYGDGTTRYDSREKAMAAARPPQEPRP